MTRWDWLLWAFRLFFSAANIQEVRAMVAALENNPKPGEAKRDFVEEAMLPALKGVSVYLLRALIEALLGQLRANER